MERTQPPPPASLYPPQALVAPYHAYDTLGGFSMGSSSYGHEAHSLAGPSSFASATGYTSARTGYAYPPSIPTLPPVFPTIPTWSGGGPDKSRFGRGALHLQASSSMAVPYAEPTSKPAAHSATAILEEGRASVASSGGSDSSRTTSRRAEDVGDQKEKKHHCWMCHKRFDRPSTLKKHLLVHTGEKAFACETCGRRFGVASNLNRHAKRCVLRPVNTKPTAGTSASVSTPSDNAALSDAATSTGQTPALSPAEAEISAEASSETSRSRKRKIAPTSDKGKNAAPADIQRKPKRSRRAPSPCRWIPESLKFFDLTPLSKGTPIPLSPVQPFQGNPHTWPEERDSYDENATENPYHPHGWNGRLPGPGLMGKDVANTSGGRLLVF